MSLTDVLIVFLCITPLLILACYCYLFYKNKRKLELLLLIATLIHETFLVSLPGLLDVFNHYKFEGYLRFPVTSADLLRVMCIENVYIFIFLVPFLILNRREAPRIKPSTPKVYDFFAIVATIGIITYIYQIIHRPSIEDIVNSYSQSGLGGSSNPLIALFNILFEHSAIIISAILAIRGKTETYPTIYQYLGIFMLLLCLALVIISGVRGRVIWVAEFTLLVALIKRKFKPILLMLLMLLIFIPINNVLVTQIRPISEEIAKEGGITNEALENIFTTVIKGFNEPHKDSPGIIESLDERAQGPRNSAIMLREYDAGRGQSISMYWGVLFYPIPRNILNRPVIGSSDLDFKNAGIFKVMDLNYPDNTFINMGPLLASAHAYWEGGATGVVIIALLSSAFWLTLFNIAYKLPFSMGIVVCMLLGCALLIDGFISVFTPLYAQLAMVWKSLLPLLVCFFIFNKIRIPKIYLRSKSLPRP